MLPGDAPVISLGGRQLQQAPLAGALSAAFRLQAIRLQAILAAVAAALAASVSKQGMDEAVAAMAMQQQHSQQAVALRLK